ncbi:MAG: NUDIX hydrolase [Mycobacteriales bacterium]
MSVPTASGAIRRRAARVLLLDGADRLLLFRGFDPGDPDEPPFWFTVGGAVDPGESVPEAAVRELREETGLIDVNLGPPVWFRDFEFRFEGVRYAQQEHFHVARVTGATIDTSGFNDIERRSVLGHRWWTADELVTTSEVIYPAELAELLPAVLAGEVPEPPLELSR